MIHVTINAHSLFDSIIQDIAKKIDEEYLLVQNWFISIILKLVDLDEVAKEIKQAIERTRAPEKTAPK